MVGKNKEDDSCEDSRKRGPSPMEEDVDSQDSKRPKKKKSRVCKTLTFTNQSLK